MDDKFDPEFDSPEARANFATRHIYNIHKRKKRREELLEQFRNEKVVSMFPGIDAKRSISKKLRLTIDYGYDIHTLEIPSLDWGAIENGEIKIISGDGFHVEGQVQQDFWRFNSPNQGDLSIYCDDGREVFEGGIEDIVAQPLDSNA